MFVWMVFCLGCVSFEWFLEDVFVFGICFCWMSFSREVEEVNTCFIFNQFETVL